MFQNRGDDNLKRVDEVMGDEHLEEVNRFALTVQVNANPGPLIASILFPGALTSHRSKNLSFQGSKLDWVLFALNQTLLQHESVRAGSLQAPYTTEDLIKHYNCGDLNAVIFNHDTSQLPNFINTTLPPHEQVTAQEIDSYFRQELIYKRNERMGKRVMALLRENQDKICFFAFGA
ncbi:hypothetical protein STEG23_001400, partial [Scotinomys teguina]